MGEGPDRGQVGGADDAEDLGGDALLYLLGRGGQAALGKGLDHDFLGPGIHQPHADHVAAKGEKRHVA